MTDIVILSFLDIIFQIKSQLVTRYSLKPDVSSWLKIPALSNCKLKTKSERMYINKHCTVHRKKSKSIHGSTPVYISKHYK